MMFVEGDRGLIVLVPRISYKRCLNRYQRLPLQQFLFRERLIKHNARIQDKK